MNRRSFLLATFVLAVVLGLTSAGRPALSDTNRAQLRTEAEMALVSLYNQDEAARTLGRRAKGILVFPKITKAGIGIGGSFGKGVLLVGGRPVDYYSIGSGSLGLTLGAQSFSQVVMFMTDDALAKFRASKGWEAGVDGTVVAIKESAGATASTVTTDEPVVGFIFGQTGLMFDASFQGSKYTRLPR